MRTANPALNDKTFGRYTHQAGTQAALDATRPGYAAPTLPDALTDRMTIRGAVNKTALLLAITVFAASTTWGMIRGDDPDRALPWMIGGVIAGLITALVAIFRPRTTPFTGPLYAVFEGLFIGGISALYEAQFGGIVFRAAALTFGVLAVLLAAYRSGLIKVTENFRLGVVAATGAIALMYVASFVLRLFGIELGFIHDNGTVGIIVSVVIVVVASLNLVLDFDFIEKGAESGAPKFLEWYAAFSLLVTLIWLYLEILRLLAKLQSRD